MEHYYFIEKDGVKKGPFTLIQLKQQTIFYDEILWRGDSDQWKRASEYDEMRDFIIIKPPPTPHERKIKSFNKEFINIFCVKLFVFYFLCSFALTYYSNEIAIEGWKDKSIFRYPRYYPGINNESIFGDNQRFWFRPFKAFWGTIYLSSAEQKSNSHLFFNLFLSSIVSLAPIFIAIGGIYYIVNRKKYT